MSDYHSERDQNCKRYLLTDGGLQRTLKSGHPEHTMHLWWTGAFLCPGVELVEANEHLIEIQLVRIEGNQAIIRIWAPDEVEILAAKKDPHCRGA